VRVKINALADFRSVVDTLTFSSLIERNPKMRKNTMLLNTIKRGLVIFVIAIFSLHLSGLVSETHAQWVDRSDELPGMNEGPSPIVYVAIGLAVVALVYVIAKAAQSKKVDEGKGGNGQLEEKKPEATAAPESFQLKELSPAMERLTVKF
jgi:hypothetical protein